MQIIFLKDHVNNKVNDSVNLNDNLAKYLVRVNVAKFSTEQAEQVAASEDETSIDTIEPEKVELDFTKREKAEKPFKKEKHKR